MSEKKKSESPQSQPPISQGGSNYKRVALVMLPIVYVIGMVSPPFHNQKDEVQYDLNSRTFYNYYLDVVNISDGNNSRRVSNTPS